MINDEIINKLKNRILFPEALEKAKKYLKNMENESFYCPICDSCGESGCCSPLSCQMSPDGQYCKTYLKDLQHGYLMYKSLYALIDSSSDENMKKMAEDVWNKNYNIVYGKG